MWRIDTIEPREQEGHPLYSVWITQTDPETNAKYEVRVLGAAPAEYLAGFFAGIQNATEYNISDPMCVPSLRTAIYNATGARL